MFLVIIFLSRTFAFGETATDFYESSHSSKVQSLKDLIE